MEESMEVQVQPEEVFREEVVCEVPGYLIEESIETQECSNGEIYSAQTQFPHTTIRVLSSNTVQGMNGLLEVIDAESVEASNCLLKLCNNDASTSMDADDTTIDVVAIDDNGTTSDMFDVTLSERFGYVYRAERAEEAKRRYESQSNTLFTPLDSVKFNFGLTEFKFQYHRIGWEDCPKGLSPIEYDGVPFIMLAKKVLGCNHTKRRPKSCKKDKEGDNEKNKQTTEKTLQAQESTMCKCTATITMRELLSFKEFKVDQDLRTKKRMARIKLRTALKLGDVQGERRIYIDLPGAASHNHEITQSSTVAPQAMDERVEHKLTELINEKSLGVEEIRMEIHKFVKGQIFSGQTPPSIRNRRYYPSRFMIRSLVNKNNAHRKPSVKDSKLLLNRNRQFNRRRWHKLQSVAEEWMEAQGPSVSPFVMMRLSQGFVQWEGPAYMQSFVENGDVIEKFKAAAQSRFPDGEASQRKRGRPRTQPRTSSDEIPKMYQLSAPLDLSVPGSKLSGKMLRRIVSRVCNRKYEKNYWMDPANKPSWWPEDVLFQSPNWVKEGCARLKTTQLLRIYEAYRSFKALAKMSIITQADPEADADNVHTSVS